MKNCKFRIRLEGDSFRVKTIDVESNRFSVKVGDTTVWLQGLEKIEQWTGLTDINGIDIYEGDIIRSQYYNESRVTWDPGCSQFLAYDVAFDLVAWEYPDNVWEVV